VSLDAYNADDVRIASAGPGTPDIDTGQMTELGIARVTHDISYVVVHDDGNYFLVDGLCSDAPGLPDNTTRNDPRNVPPGQAQDSAWWEWPDGDDDGLPDYWETSGVWVGTVHVDLPAMGASPARRDAFVWVDQVDGETWNRDIERIIARSFAASPLRITMHFVGRGLTIPRAKVPPVVTAGRGFFLRMAQLGFRDSGFAGAPGSVPALAKYICVCPDHYDALADGQLVNGKGIGGEAIGIKGDYLVDTMNERAWQSAITRATGLKFDLGDPRVSAQLNAVNAMHELGHLYGLRHNGTKDIPTVDPGYHSIMTYAYSAFGVPTGSPGFPAVDFSRSTDGDHNLDWRSGPGDGQLSLVWGQDGGHPGFYNATADIPEPDGGQPAEPTIEAALSDPAGAAATTEAVREILAEKATPHITPTPTPTATPTVSPTVTPAPVDSTAPTVKLAGASRRALGRRFKLRLTCSETCVLTVEAKIKVLRKPLGLKTVRTSLQSGRPRTLTIKLPKRTIRQVRRALRHGRKCTLRLTITAADGVGNVRTSRRTIRLKP
jgi:hypothetical protein